MDVLPLFSLHIDGDAELATVRPRDGSLLLVESMSPTEVVLRLRPSPDDPASAPAAERTPTAAAVEAGSEPAQQRGQEASEQPEAAPDISAQTTAEDQARPDDTRPANDSAGSSEPIAPSAPVGEPPVANAASDTEEVERAPSNITAEQLSAAQLAVQRAIRGLTGPDAAKHLDVDADLERSPLTRHSYNEGGPAASTREGSGHGNHAGGHGGRSYYLSPGSTPSGSPRGSRSLRGSGSGQDWGSVPSSRRPSNGPSSRRSSGMQRSPGRAAEREAYGSVRLRHAGAPEPDWPAQQRGAYRQAPPPPPRGRQLGSGGDGRPWPGAGRQPLLPGAALGSPAPMISKVKMSMDSEAAALQQAAMQQQAMMHRRALRNGALAAARPVTHEAFEFWHEQPAEAAASASSGGALGLPLDTHGSLEGSVYSDLQTDEAAHAVAQWTAMRLTPSPALSHGSYSSAGPPPPPPPQQQLYGRRQQQQEDAVALADRFREPTLRAEDYAQLGYGSGLSAAAPEFSSSQEPQTERQADGVASGLKERRFSKDSWPPPPPDPQPSGGNAYAQQALSGHSCGGGDSDTYSRIAAAAHLMHEHDGRSHCSATSFCRGSPTLQDGQPQAHAPSAWGSARTAYPHNSRSASMASEEERALAYEWRLRQQQQQQQQMAPQQHTYEAVRRSSEPTLSGEASAGLSRFANLQRRSLSDTPSFGSNDAAAGRQAQFQQQGDQPLPALAEAIATQMPPALFPDKMFEAHKAWSLSSADVEAFSKSTAAAASEAVAAVASSAANEQPLPMFPLPANMLGFLDDDNP